MLLKTKTRENYKVLGVNAGVLLAFILLAISLPIIVRQIKLLNTEADAETEPPHLACEYCGAESNPLGDYAYRWQISLQGKDFEIYSWTAIYENYLSEPWRLKLSPELKVVQEGLIYTGPLDAITTYKGWALYDDYLVLVQVAE